MSIRPRWYSTTSFTVLGCTRDSGAVHNPTPPRSLLLGGVVDLLLLLLLLLPMLQHADASRMAPAGGGVVRMVERAFPPRADLIPPGLGMGLPVGMGLGMGLGRGLGMGLGMGCGFGLPPRADLIFISDRCQLKIRRAG